jgi:hypothetical protein
MSKKQTFSTSSFDKLINDSIIESDQLKNQLQTVNLNGDISFNNTDIDDYLPENDKAFSEKNNIISDEGDSVCYSYIYKKIGDLVDTGNASLQMLQSIDPDVTNPGTLGATASLLNSIRGCISEFTKIHQQYIRFQQTLQLEKIKLENKKELIKYRRAVNNGQLESEVSPTELIETSSTDIMNYIAFKKEQEENEKAKNEKV